MLLANAPAKQAEASLKRYMCVPSLEIWADGGSDELAAGSFGALQGTGGPGTCILHCIARSAKLTAPKTAYFPCSAYTLCEQPVSTTVDSHSHAHTCARAISAPGMNVKVPVTIIRQFQLLSMFVSLVQKAVCGCDHTKSLNDGRTDR